VTVIAPVGDQGYADFVAHPAALDTTLAVGATPDSSDRPGNRGAGLDLVAPGADSVAASAAVASFVAGLPRDDPEQVGPPDLRGRPRDVFRRLVGSAFDEGPIGWDPVWGHGRLDPVGARHWSRRMPEPRLIVAHQVARRSGHRAVVSWVTDEAASSVVTWDGGRDEREHPSVTHRVVVSGTPGDIRRFAIVSVAGHRRDTRRVTVQF